MKSLTIKLTLTLTWLKVALGLCVVWAGIVPKDSRFDGLQMKKVVFHKVFNGLAAYQHLAVYFLENKGYSKIGNKRGIA